MSLLVDIRKSLGEFTLNIKFTAQNEIMGLLGASGCGKSLSLKCIAGIETPDEGRIVLDNKVLFDSEMNINLPPQQRKTGYLFQNYALFPNMTVEENIASGINRPKAEKTKIVKDKIEMFYLKGLEKKRPDQLSGGQQQRVALARIIASEPDMIMLDEPFCALDSYLKWQLEQELMELLSNFSGTVLLVSHNRNEVYRFSDSVTVISDGKVDVMSSKEELFKDPKTMSAALLTGCKNISRAERINDHSIKAVDWDMILYSRREVPENIKHVGMRAHNLKYTENNDEPNTMNCEVLKVIENPFSYIIILKNKLSDNNKSSCRLRWEADKDAWMIICSNGGTVRLIFDQDNLMLLT